MGRLTCKCLNISVHTKAKPEPLDPSALRLPAGERDVDFFKGQVAEIQLDLGGISEEQKCLIRRSSVGEWVVRTCTNCETDCYATHATKGMNRVLVSLSLVSDTEKQEELRRSPSFSPLFHVILHEISKTKSPTLGHPTTSNQDALKKTVGDLQDQLSRYLTKEKASMEERIKKFTEDQQAAYNSLQKKAYRDKNLMVGLMVEADEKSLEDSISEAMLETTLTPPHTPVSLSKNRVNSSLPPISMSYPRTFHGEIATAKEKPREVPVKAYGGPQRSGATPRGVAKTRHRSNDADTMFDLDGFNDDCDPFFESDDESSTDAHLNPTPSLPADNSLNDDHLTRTMSGRGTSSRAAQNFATSVPISMPVWNREAKLSLEDEDDDDDKVPMPEPDHMVASMKALSLSVQDGTEMFGDLPRPRLNTGDAISLSKKINL
ncbi:uncharacterized protein LOC119726045 isoform X2 [Patiria miniata]|uniref:Uncharacterized protein n=1 Tax=Patiria miniata TaxID=46514 RepID=A0A913ZQE1_PATMI|nr:uncharacterized protein LOC119726045 isoform X2 [Patiria miniata]